MSKNSMEKRGKVALPWQDDGATQTTRLEPMEADFWQTWQGGKKKP